MELGQRQRAYARRASQQEDLAELRSRHEQFRSSMFSSSGGFAPELRHGTGSSEGRGGVQRSMDSDKPTDRIEAAILAGMAVDATRGANTFNRTALTPAHSGSSSSYQGGVDPGSRPGTGRVSNGGIGGGGNGALFGQNLMPTPPGAMHGGGGGGGGGVRNGYYTGGGGDTGYYGDGSGGVYNTYHPQSGGAGGVGGGGGGGGDGGYPMRAVPADGLGASGSLVRSEGSHGAASGSRGGGSAGGGSGSSIGDVFRYSGEDPAHQHPPHQHPSHQHPHPQRGDSGGSGGRSGSSAGGGSTERRRRPPSGPGYGREAGRGMPPVHQGSGSSGPSDEGRPEIAGAGQEAFGPPESDEDVTPVKAVSGGSSLNPGEGGGVSLTPRGGGEDSLELPDGCHHISLSKFLEVMTGPGLRVRKHHRAGKGSSGLRVLRYAPDDDSLTWDSHKILGAAQHVLPMADITSVSMQSGNRVVLTCVGGRDSYAVFEAANNDAGAVLFVGLERLRKRTVS